MATAIGHKVADESKFIEVIKVSLLATLSGYSPQVVSISSLSRAQVGHEMGHSFGFLHENIRPDQTNYLTVLSNNVTSGNLGLFQIDPTSVTNGNYDFESVMHLSWDFASVQPGVLATQQPKPAYFPRYQFRMGNYALSPDVLGALLSFPAGDPALAQLQRDVLELACGAGGGR